jgi:protein-S-isoprenylcysteine O-methyltransferase Ste14
MRPGVDALIVLVGVFGSGLLGLSLRSVLPEGHLHEDSLTMVRLCTGVIATLAALVLGLLVASAKTNYDRVNDEITQAAASVVLLDRTLAHFGPQTKEARTLLHTAVASVANTVFSQDGRGVMDLDDPRRAAGGEEVQAAIRKLTPESEVQRTLQTRALDLSNEVAKMRLLTITQAQGSIPGGFLVVLLLWLAIMFAGFGLVTARNPTVVVTLFLCALSLAGAIFMIEELNRPLEGFLKISGAPIQFALSHIGQ